MGIDPAEFQSALWVGGKDITKVRDARNLPAVINRSIARVAEDLDMPEQEVLIKFINGDVVLKGIVLGIATSFGAAVSSKQNSAEL
jgi:hypothetical protein